jgi:hypothetical protein
MIPQLQTLKTGWHNFCCYNSNKNVTFSLMSIYTKMHMHIWAVQKALNPKNWMTQFLLWFNQLSFSWWSSKNKCTQLLCSHNCFTKEFKIWDHLKSWEMENFTLIIIQYAPSSSSSSSLFYVFKILNSMIKECNLTDAKFFVCPKNPHEDIYSCSKALNLQYS